MRLFVIVVLIVVGALALVAGIIYLVEPSHSLPSFFPGYMNNPGRPVASGEFHQKKGLAGVALGSVLLIAGVLVAVIRPASRPGRGQ